jgi:DNA ligase (NAD+)
MDIDGLGEKLIDQLVDRGLLKTFADLYRLTPESIATLSSEAEQNGKLVKRTVGQKVAQKIVDNAAKSRHQPLDRLLAGLGIRHVGNRVAHVLATHFGSLDALAEASQEELSAVNEIGPAIADSVHDFFTNDAGRRTLSQLKSVGIDPKMKVVRRDSANLPLSGKSVVVTGTLDKFDRKQIEDFILKLGGKASGSVSKKTSFVVAGESAGSKLDKAKSLGVEVIDEAEFIRRYGSDS